MGSSYHSCDSVVYDQLRKHPFAIVFRCAGTVWPLVLPYCVLNILLLTALTILKDYYDINISIQPQGHALMALLVSYLGVSKVNLAYERYMSAQVAAGHALMTLRELNQMSIMMTDPFEGAGAEEWREDTKQSIVQLIHESVSTLRDGKLSAALARNVGYPSGSVGVDAKTSRSKRFGLDDPMVLVHALRSHLFHESDAVCRNGDGGPGLQLFERTKMVDLLHDFAIYYRDLLRIASSPFPFALVQMGRTFTFIWTLTIPFVLAGKDFVQDYPSSFSFVILLTYGFLGLEFVFRMLTNPFGDEIRNDLNIKGMGAATVIGIEEDSELSREDHKKRRMNGGDKRRVGSPSPSLRNLVQHRYESMRLSNRSVVLDGGRDVLSDNRRDDALPYRAMV